MEWILGIVVVAVVVALILSRHHDNAGTSYSEETRGRIFEPADWTPARDLSPSAIDLLQIIERLRSVSAQWPEILAAVNPTGDASTQRALIALRSSHQFVPHIALNVVETGCHQAIEKNVHAGQLEALRSAKIVVNYGD